MRKESLSSENFLEAILSQEKFTFIWERYGFWQTLEQLEMRNKKKMWKKLVCNCDEWAHFPITFWVLRPAGSQGGTNGVKQLPYDIICELLQTVILHEASRSLVSWSAIFVCVDKFSIWHPWEWMGLWKAGLITQTRLSERANPSFFRRKVVFPKQNIFWLPKLFWQIQPFTQSNNVSSQQHLR